MHERFQKSGFSLEVEILQFVCFLNAFHICCSETGKGLMSRAEQVAIAGTGGCPATVRTLTRTRIHVCKTLLHLTRHSSLHLNSALSQASPLKIAYWV